MKGNDKNSADKNMLVISRELSAIRKLLTLIAVCVVTFVFLPELPKWIVDQIRGFFGSGFAATMLLTAIGVFVVLYIVNKIQGAAEDESANSQSKMNLRDDSSA